ncbi:hypothetical protein [Rhodoferax sp.]|uniref:hypothetical protein n=1 Tax=Rhodoferax sp. TaxID=50421 RepID=UPI003BB5E6D2
MQSEFMDCHASLAMNSRVIVKVAVIANAVKQSMTSEGMDRHGLRPRDDGVRFKVGVR